MSKKPFQNRLHQLAVELATVQYANHDQITEIAFRVFGGRSHGERLEAATEALESYTAYFEESEGTVVSIDSYEVTSQETEKGTPYVLFTYGNMPTVTDVTTNN